MMSAPSGAARWNERYAEAEYVYGTEPNDFLVSVAKRIPPGPVLCLAEGEGRNAVFLARQGHAVTAVDFAEAGLAKARRLARSAGVAIETEVADLAAYRIEPASWSAIILIFAHLEAEHRVPLHRAAVRGLKAGGALVLEAFTPEPGQFSCEQPGSESRLMCLDTLREELRGLRLVIAREIQREISEGRLHQGRRSVVQLLGFRSAEPEPGVAGGYARLRVS